MMEYDAQKEVRVWQRVQEEKQTPLRQGESLNGLIMEQMQLSAQYLHLARLWTGRDGTVLMALARQARAQAACLRGISVLVTGTGPAPAPVQPQNTNQEAMLRRCYGQELRLMKEYENCRGNPEYGHAYAAMARRAQEHCCKLLELIGNMKQSGK